MFVCLFVCLFVLIWESETSLDHIGMQGVEVWKFGFFFIFFSFFFLFFLLILFFHFQSILCPSFIIFPFFSLFLFFLPSFFFFFLVCLFSFFFLFPFFFLFFFTFDQFYVLPSSFSLSFLFSFLSSFFFFFWSLSLLLGILYTFKGIMYKTFCLLNVFLCVMQFFISTCCDVSQVQEVGQTGSFKILLTVYLCRFSA